MDGGDWWINALDNDDGTPESQQNANASRSVHKLASLIAKRPGNVSEYQQSLEQAKNGEGKQIVAQKP